MASRTVNGDRARIGARTLRKDRWWLPPLVTVAVLGAFVVYGTWVAFFDRDYFVDPYLSPFYSPCLTTSCEEPTWAILGGWWPLSPALLVLPFPLGFRLTCAVPDARPRYTGETRFPLILQNIHRYFFYLALPFPLILAWDALRAFSFPEGFGIGLGTVILLVNAVFLALYTLSCHSCRHLCGGGLNSFAGRPVRFWMWRQVSALNARHMLLAWVSLVFVALADLYVRLVATGVISDPRVVF
jgi:hypothetical protein